MYDCPKCGAPRSSIDGIVFCISCEKKYQEDQKQYWKDMEEQKRKIRATHADDCDCDICHP